MKDKVDKKIKEIIHAIENNSKSIEGYGLLSGNAGVSLFLYYAQKYMGRFLPNINWADKLDSAIDMVADEPSYPTYSSGIAGLCYILSFFKEEKLIEDLITEEINTYLLQALRYEMKKKHYDFLHGVIGIAYYFYKARHISYLEETLFYLLNTVEYNNSQEYFKWVSYNSSKDKFEYNISLSHGMASIVCFLLKLYGLEEFEKKIIEDTIIKAINYILLQEIDRDQYNCLFPYTSKDSTMILNKSRLAWCYGDLTIATTLYQAGNKLNQQKWIDKAIEILLYAVENRKSLGDNLVIDAGLCHGTAGIGHIFYRMWWNTQMPEFKKAADYWFQETLKMAHFEDGLAGYKSWHGEIYGGWKNTYGLLDGIAGIGLALLSYHYEVEPTWDQCLLLS